MSKPANLAARLRHRITIQQPDLQAGDGGQYDITWNDVATVWAEIIPQAGRSSAELVMSEQQYSMARHRITLRYREGVTASMRVKFANRHFNIRSVISPEEKKVLLVLFADENVAQ